MQIETNTKITILYFLLQKHHMRLEHEENTFPTWILCYRQLSYGEGSERGFRGDCIGANLQPALAFQEGIE